MGYLKLIAVWIFRKTALATFIIILPVLYLVEPFRKIRLGELIDDRIGHLAVNTLIFVRQQEMNGGAARTTHIFIASNPANVQLLRMWKRKLNIVQSLWLRRVFAGIAPVLKKTRFYQSLDYVGIEHKEMSVKKPILSFTDEEEKHGQDLLQKMGISENDWFVCFHARDPSYLVNRSGHGIQDNLFEVRNCSINNYAKAARWISDQGGFVLRMGKIVDTSLDIADPRIIDYSTLYQNDFMDVYLSAKCRFFLGCSCGLLYVPMLFGVPMGATNFAPFCDTGHGLLTTYIPKHLRRKGAVAFTSFVEARDIGLYDIQPGANIGWNKRPYYDASDTELVENDEDDILDLCMDMMDIISGKASSSRRQRLQGAYRKLYNSTLNDNTFAGQVGPRFAEKYAALIELNAN